MLQLTSSFLLAPVEPAEGLDDACGDSPGKLCQWVYDQTENETLASLVDWAFDRPLRIFLILVAALVITGILRRAIARFARRLSADEGRLSLRRVASGRGGSYLVGGDLLARSKARTETLSTVLRGVVTATVWTIATLLILGELDINLGPFIAGAGIAGVALGFGAQRIVQDFLSGFFMLVEDQFGVGDIVDVGTVSGPTISGVVERVTLRVTMLRDVEGVVWHVPNGEIHRVANKSQLWSRAVLDIEVSYSTDLRRAREVLQRVADDLWQDESFTAGKIVERPEVWGVEQLGPSGVLIRLVTKTEPADQWIVARELRLRIKEAFDAEGIEIPQ